MKSVNWPIPGYASITCSTISNIPYNLIFTTKFNDSLILITIISCDYLNLSLADEHIGDVTIPTQVIEYNHRGSQLYFHIARYMLKEKGGHFFCCPKNFGTFFRFKNGLVFVLTIILMQISLFFADWLVYSGITLVFKFQAVWTTSYHTHFWFIRT
jgi:hypothetical protein